jgi:hypothetical protein
VAHGRAAGERRYPPPVAEYDLICDSCHETVDSQLAIVSWKKDGPRESGFALTHAEHVPADASDRAEVRRLVGPNEFLRFLTERFGTVVADPEPLRAIAWALAPFVMRHDNSAEMDTLRAASFGERPGVKPGTIGGAAVKTPQATEVEGGK